MEQESTSRKCLNCSKITISPYLYCSMECRYEFDKRRMDEEGKPAMGYEMRKDGYIWKDIADELDYTSGQVAFNVVKQYAIARGLEFPVKLSSPMSGHHRSYRVGFLSKDGNIRDILTQKIEDRDIHEMALEAALNGEETMKNVADMMNINLRTLYKKFKLCDSIIGEDADTSDKVKYMIRNENNFIDKLNNIIDGIENEMPINEIASSLKTSPLVLKRAIRKIGVNNEVIMR